MNKPTNLTEKEINVYNAAIDICQDYSADVPSLAKATGYDKATVVGVVGSLVKKGFMATEDEERGGKMFNDIWPLVGYYREVFCFGGQSLDLDFESPDDFKL